MSTARLAKNTAPTSSYLIEPPRHQMKNVLQPVTSLSMKYPQICNLYSHQPMHFGACCQLCTDPKLKELHNSTPQPSFQVSLSVPVPIQSTPTTLRSSIDSPPTSFINDPQLARSDLQLDDLVVDSIITKCFDSVERSMKNAPQEVTLDSEEIAPHGQMMASTSHSSYDYSDENPLILKSDELCSPSYAVAVSDLTELNLDGALTNSTYELTRKTNANTDLVISTANSESAKDRLLKKGSIHPPYHNVTTVSDGIANICSEYTDELAYGDGIESVDDYASTNDQPSSTDTSISEGRVRKKSKRARARARAWTTEEQKRFEESLELYGRNWEMCAAYIGTRKTPLVRSHAQKHLIKLWKLGKPLPKKLAESGSGYTLSGKPLLPDSASAKSYLLKLPCPASEKSEQ